jgi:5-oxoprolinase (ATP-hydrolysing) subunit A
MLKINCDLGESQEMADDGRQQEMLSLIDLANVCCGAHAGSLELTRKTMEQAAQAGVRVGAHPGYADREFFGRRPMFGKVLRAKDIVDLVSEQVGSAVAAADEFGLKLYHVKPHGALYNEAAEEGEVAEAIALGVMQVLRDVCRMGLAKSTMVGVFRRQGFVVLREAFADRRYTAEGLLVPRTEPGAMVEDAREAREQMLRLAGFCDTICVHSDSPGALDLIRALRD